MLLFRNYVAKSQIHGIGLYTDQFILAGTEVWVPGFEVLFTQEQFDALPIIQQSLVTNCGFHDKKDGMWHLSLDNDRFINHSKAPNVGGDYEHWVALRDIEQDEEIIEDYSYYDLSAETRLK